MEGRTEKISDILKDYVIERKKVNPKLSESQIAKHLGISITSFHRMLNYNAYPIPRPLLKQLFRFLTVGEFSACFWPKLG